MNAAEVFLPIDDGVVLRELAGDLGGHLRLATEVLGVSASVRGPGIVFRGEVSLVETAKRVFSQLETLVRDGRALHPAEVRDALRFAAVEPLGDVRGLLRDVLVHDRRRQPITARTANQRLYIEALRASQVVFGLGPAGTGKTFLAIAAAVGCLQRGEVKRIILSRPAVEAGEKLGFLPGDLAQKVDPYLRPLFDALGDLIEPAELERLFAKGVIEIAPLAFMRGRTLADGFVVLDEAQNTTPDQMKMFLTRLGHGARMVITGDPSQVDLPRGARSGLVHAVDVLADVDGIDIVRFGTADVVRHPLVAAILTAWDAAGSTRD